MKKLLVVLLALMLTAGTTVYALEESRNCTISLNVPTDFYLDLGANWIDFGNVIEGQSTGEKNLLINTVSTTGNNWELRFSNTLMVSETNSSDVIPDSNCNMQFNMDTNAIGTSNYTGGGTFPGSAGADLYNSGLKETGNLYHTAVLSVDVPTGQASGWYTSVITFTMVEVT